MNDTTEEEIVASDILDKEIERIANEANDKFNFTQGEEES